MIGVSCAGTSLCLLSVELTQRDASVEDTRVGLRRPLCVQYVPPNVMNLTISPFRLTEIMRIGKTPWRLKSLILPVAANRRAIQNRAQYRRVYGADRGVTMNGYGGLW